MHIYLDFLCLIVMLPDFPVGYLLFKAEISDGSSKTWLSCVGFRADCKVIAIFKGSAEITYFMLVMMIYDTSLFFDRQPRIFSVYLIYVQ